MNCLITGILGFVGKNLARELQKNNYYISGLDKIDASDVTSEFYKADICNWDELNALQFKEPVDYIIHLAALTDPDTVQDLMYKVNVKGTENICKLGQKLHIKKIIYISTVSVYSNFDLKYIDESTPVNPVNYYGATKLEAERIIQNSGLNWTILRPTNIFGIAGDKYSNYFNKIKQRGIRIGVIFYYFRNTHLLYLFDFIDVIKICIINEMSDNNIFIISNDDYNIMEKNIIDYVMNYLKVKTLILPSPLFWKNIDKRIFLNSILKTKLNYKINFGVYKGLLNYFNSSNY